MARQDVVNLIDIARRDGAGAYLITATTKSPSASENVGLEICSDKKRRTVIIMTKLWRSLTCMSWLRSMRVRYLAGLGQCPRRIKVPEHFRGEA